VGFRNKNPRSIFFPHDVFFIGGGPVSFYSFSQNHGSEKIVVFERELLFGAHFSLSREKWEEG